MATSWRHWSAYISECRRPQQGDVGLRVRVCNIHTQIDTRRSSDSIYRNNLSRMSSDVIQSDHTVIDGSSVQYAVRSKIYFLEIDSSQGAIVAAWIQMVCGPPRTFQTTSHGRTIMSSGTLINCRKTTTLVFVHLLYYTYTTYGKMYLPTPSLNSREKNLDWICKHN